MERDLYLAVMDGRADLAALLFQVNQHNRQIEILRWLVSNKLTGARLASFFEGEAQRSFLAVIKFVVMKLEKESQARPVLGSEFGLKRL